MKIFTRNAGENSLFQRFVDALNRRPLVWTIGLLVPVYLVSFILAFAGLAAEPHLYSPLISFICLLVAAFLVMAYHWTMSRYQRTSNLAQCIQFIAGLVPIVGSFIVLIIVKVAISAA